MTSSDCGPAALAMVLAYHGRHVPLDEVRRAAQPGRDGSSAATLLQVGSAYGLRGRSVSLDIDELRALPAGSVLHWQFRHYVVFQGVRRSGVAIADPASGRRTVPLASFRRSFTGVALVFEPSETFIKSKPRSRRFRLRPLLVLLLEHRGAIAWLVGISLLIQVLSAALPLLTGVLIDRVVPRQDYSLLMLIASAYFGLQVFSSLSGFAREHLSIHLRTRLESAFTLRFVDHLVDLPYEFFQQRTSGDLMMRLGSNTAVREILTSTLLSTMLDGLMASTYLILLMLFSRRLTLIVLLLAALRLAALTVMRWKQRQLLAESVENQARSQTAQVEMLTAMETLKAMGLEQRAVASFSNVFVEGLNNSVKRGRLEANFNLLLGLLGIGTTLALMFYGVYLVLEGAWTLGSMMAFNALAGSFLGPFNSLASSALRFQMLEVYLERLNDVLDMPREQDETATAQEISLHGAISVEHVSFRYSATGPWALEDVTLTVPAGSRVAIVGATGSGKSSLARLMGGLYVPHTGRVCFDGVNLITLDRRAVRRQLGIVTQDTQLFGGTIRSNVALANPEMSLDRVVTAAKMACIHDEIVAMGMKYDTPLTDRGMSLSGGQRQRLALARAIAADPRLVILDEATSHLDAVTEQRVNDNLRSLPCTQIVIAHRLSTIQHADHIIVLDRGRIIETGNHWSLLRAGGKYAELIGAQRETGGPTQRGKGATA